jgi:formate hydrogenlyase subunit 3/multisubunit Na+/H+ antiporter MnhD subunit
MKTWIVALAFVAILASLAFALVYMMRGGTHEEGQAAPKRGNMAKALAFRVGFSILLFVCVLLSWKMGWIQPTGIPPGA